VLHQRVEGRTQFLDLLRHLELAAKRNNLRPLLHIEAHGSLNQGLHFADGSVVTWSEFCEALAPLNRAVDLRLAVIVAACFGITL